MTEREAFENWYCKNHTGLKQSDLAKFRTLSGYSFSGSLKINISWETWQAAKNQAVPDGFVVVPKEPTDAMIKAGYKHCEMTGILPHSFYKAMIEAQEQTNDK